MNEGRSKLKLFDAEKENILSSPGDSNYFWGQIPSTNACAREAGLFSGDERKERACFWVMAQFVAGIADHDWSLEEILGLLA
jgi:hypothetical protein